MTSGGKNLDSSVELALLSYSRGREHLPILFHDTVTLVN